MQVHKTTRKEVPDLGTRIKEARERDQRALTEICALAGMTTANWYRIEGGETKSLPLETLRRIEEALNVDFGVKL